MFFFIVKITANLIRFIIIMRETDNKKKIQYKHQITIECLNNFLFGKNMEIK